MLTAPQLALADNSHCVLCVSLTIILSPHPCSISRGWSRILDPASPDRGRRRRRRRRGDWSRQPPGVPEEPASVPADETDHPAEPGPAPCSAAAAGQRQPTATAGQTAPPYRFIHSKPVQYRTFSHRTVKYNKIQTTLIRLEWS